jgi:hypothetical protein
MVWKATWPGHFITSIRETRLGIGNLFYTTVVFLRTARRKYKNNVSIFQYFNIALKLLNSSYSQ